MSAARAWPYAVTRGATSGYQAIVAPAFLAEAGQAYVLEYASRQETREPGIVTVREVVGATAEPLSLAYRVLEARADRYGLDGADPLQDRAGRATWESQSQASNAVSRGPCRHRRTSTRSAGFGKDLEALSGHF